MRRQASFAALIAFFTACGLTDEGHGPSALEGSPPGATAAPGELPRGGGGSALPVSPREVSPPKPSPPSPVAYPRACHELYAQDELPTFELEMSSSTWRQLLADFDTIPQREEYRPAKFSYAGQRVDAQVRLRGNNSRCGGKLQFAISFNQVDPKARFRGLRRINLDHGGCDLFNERLALAFTRDLGLEAPCANNARLVVNGEYYGLFVNLEHVGKDFLKRNFAADDGNLYKNGYTLKTNEASATGLELDPFRQARTVEELAKLVDVRQAVQMWAAEAVLPARDNFWFKNRNYYLYQHPRRGFVFILADLDQALPGSQTQRLDIFYPAQLPHPAEVLLNDREWDRAYRAELNRVIDAYTLEYFHTRIDGWWAQVKEAAEADTHGKFGLIDVTELKAQIADRVLWLQGWRETH